MTGPADREWRERAAMDYLDALDAGDAEAFARLWERAASDPELEEFLRDLGEGLLEAEGPGSDFAADAQRVRSLAVMHLPAFAPPESPPGPLTAADVARRLQSEVDLGGRLDPADRLANALILARDAPLPDPLRLSGLDAWGGSLGVTAGPRYWSAFHGVAVMLRLARCQQEGRLAAARRADPKAEGRGRKS